MTNEELVENFQKGDKQALEELLNYNVGIISKIAHKYCGIAKSKYLEFDDLFNSGVIGLIKAANGYIFDNENLFFSYAYPCIKHEILACVNGRTSKDINNNNLSNQSISINTPYDEERELELVDTIKSEEDEYQNIEDKILLDALRQELEETMNLVLTLNECEIIKLSYGWEGKSLTHRDIGNKLNISLKQTKTLAARAWRKLRGCEWMHKRGKEYENELVGEQTLDWSRLMKQ